jgi:hypothetical protein
VSSWPAKLLYTNDFGWLMIGGHRARGPYEPEDVEAIWMCTARLPT